jgi:hypothetical protein
MSLPTPVLILLTAITLLAIGFASWAAWSEHYWRQGLIKAIKERGHRGWPVGTRIPFGDETLDRQFTDAVRRGPEPPSL